MKYALLLCLFLTACGGGGCNPCEPEPTPAASTQPVKCADNPKLCG